MTIVAPGGVDSAIEAANPTTYVSTEITPETTVTERNVLQIRIAVSDGKTIKLEINIAPIIFIPMTIVIAVRTANSVLYEATFTPIALPNDSSKETRKNL